MNRYALLLGILLPPVLQVAITAALHWVEQHLGFGGELVAAALFFANVVVGFTIITDRFTKLGKIVTAFGYVPLMFILLFTETYYIAVRYLGSDTF